MKVIYSYILVAAVAICSCQNQKKDNTTNRDIEEKTNIVSSLNTDDINFGLVNETASDIVLFDVENAISDPNIFAYAFINQSPVALEYIKQQEADSTANGNQTQHEFDKVAGALFRITKKLALKNNDIPYVLVSSAAFQQSREIVSTTDKFENIASNSIKNTVTTDYNNTIKTSKLIATSAQQDSIFLVQLAPIKDSITVLLAAIDGKSKEIFIQEFKAEYNEISTWRVDDGGLFPFEDFKILNIFKANGKMELVSYFPGAEGANFNYLISDDKGQLTAFKSAYAYWGFY